MNDILATEKLSVLMRKYSLPCIVSLLVGALYNIVDQVFIANATYLGSYGNAANTVVFPLTVIVLAIAVMIGDGCCAFVSISNGQGNKKDSANAIGSSVVMLIISSLVMTAVYIIAADFLVTIFGARVNEQTYNLCREYFFWISVGVPFYVFGQGINPIIRSDGSPKVAMIATLTGAVLNIILDPVFIFVFKWGMMGAAIATVIGQIATAVFSIVYLCHMKTVKLEKENFKIHWNLAKKYIPLGMTSFFSQISLVAAMAAVNNMIRKYGAMDLVFGQEQYAQIPMAVLGIVMKYFQIVISIVVGMSAGCIPVAGYNMGAGLKKRAKKLFILLLVSEAAIGTVATFFAEVMPEKIINIFGAANESHYYREFAVKAFRTYLCMLIPACVNKATFIYLQALGKPFLSSGLSVLREIVLGVGAAIVLPVFFKLDGVLYSMPFSDIVAFIACLLAIIHTVKSLESEKLAV